MIRFIKFGDFVKILPIVDGDNFLVVFPDGVVRMCYYSWRGYFEPLENFESENIKYNVNSLECYDSILISKVEVVEWI